MGIREREEESLSGWLGSEPYFGSYWVWDGERDPGVVDGSKWGVWPLGCTSTHLALIRFPSASMFSWILLSSLSAFRFVIEAPRKRGDRLPLLGTGISEQISWR